MGIVTLDMTMTLDGYVTAPNVDMEKPLGEGGERIHDWMFSRDGKPATAAEARLMEEFFSTAGAFVMGRRVFDVGINHWGPDGAFGAPCFVVTHRKRDPVVRGPTTFHFVTEGVRKAVEQARAAAGSKNVTIMGGADIAQQCLREGLVQELRIHIASLVFGGGTRLFGNPCEKMPELELVSVKNSALAVHVVYRVRN